MAGRGGLVAEPKIAGSLTQSSQRKTMQAASSQLIKKLSTTRLKRSVSFGQEKKNPQWRRFIRRQGKARQGGRVVASRFREATAMMKKVVNKED